MECGSWIRNYMSKGSDEFDDGTFAAQIPPAVRRGIFQQLFRYHHLLKNNLRPMWLQGYPEWVKVGVTMRRKVVLGSGTRLPMIGRRLRSYSDGFDDLALLTGFLINADRQVLTVRLGITHVLGMSQAVASASNGWPGFARRFRIKGRGLDET